VSEGIRLQKFISRSGRASRREAEDLMRTGRVRVNGEAVMDLMKELHEDGATICMVTHDPRYARYADRTIHLFDGQVVRDEDTRNAKELEESGFEVHH
jgi:16S rRNA U516 pseudouridylate synthase RsuA-like enzyme